MSRTKQTYKKISLVLHFHILDSFSIVCNTSFQFCYYACCLLEENHYVFIVLFFIS